MKNAHRQVLKTYMELESFGLGLKELKILVSTIREISSANEIHPIVATSRFCSHIEEDYDRIWDLDQNWRF